MSRSYTIYIYKLNVCCDPINVFIFSGTVLVRKMKTLPRNKCWFVGYSRADAVDIASEFNRSWDTHLRVGLHDCRDYTNGNHFL